MYPINKCYSAVALVVINLYLGNVWISLVIYLHYMVYAWMKMGLPLVEKQLIYRDKSQHCKCICDLKPNICSCIHQVKTKQQVPVKDLLHNMGLKELNELRILWANVNASPSFHIHRCIQNHQTMLKHYAHKEKERIYDIVSKERRMHKRLYYTQGPTPTCTKTAFRVFFSLGCQLINQHLQRKEIIEAL